MISDGPIRIEQIGDADAQAWDAFVASKPSASLYHRYAWRHVIRESFGRETFYLAAREGGRICGVLPIARLKSFMFGDLLVSLPYFNYGGPVADSAEVGQQLIESACSLARDLGVSHLELREREPRPGLAARTDKVTMLIELPSSSEVLWKKLRSHVRSQVRRAQKHGAVAVHGKAELLDDFYAVFAENMRDLGTPVYGKPFFACMLRRFPDNASIFVVRVNNAPVAAGFLLGDGRTLEIPWASSLRRANPMGVNRFMHWSVLEYACQAGYSTFDFGRSTAGSGTYKYKEEWGAVPHGLHWHYWLRSGGEPPKLNPSNPKYKAAIAAWQKLPLAIANALGPLIVRNIP
ncbi:MAG TPA: FemAB family XrtA/PEP-CTERM system-associated protein [Steroidobacteraceae bacterium]